MSKRVAIITDSTCDIPSEWRIQYDITVIPLTIVWGEDQYLDGVELTAEQFYDRLPQDARHPSTSQPTPQRFLEAYQKAEKAGAQEIIVFTISQAMSGTIESARQAALGFPIPVHIVDSKNNSLGLGWQVIAAARVREMGGDVDAMLDAAEHVRKHMVYYVALDTMEYLSKGGRIGSATKFLSSVLHIKPIIYVNPQTGTVAPSIPARSRVGAIESLYREFFRHLHRHEDLHIAVLHNAVPGEAAQLAQRVMEEFNPKEIFISIVSPVLGAHTGPNAIALCGYAEG